MTNSTLLDDRYGRTRRKGVTRAWWIGVAVVALAAIALIGWFTYANARYQVSSDDLAYEVVDAHSTTVRFQFASRPGEDVTCVLEALDEDFGVVGFRVIDYPAAAAHQQQHVETIRTVDTASTGVVKGCFVS